MLAPTGTISFMMDCDTTGIEPDIALVKYKQLAGGGMLKIVNQTVPLALRTLGYDDAADRGDRGLHRQRTTRSKAPPDLKAEHLPVFDCAFQPRNGTRSIAWRAHVRMMAAAQPFLSGAISKTVNMPRETHAGRHRRRLPGRLAAGPEGAGHLPRRLEGEPAAVDEAPKATRRPRSSVGRAAPRAAARHAAVDHPQVQRRGPRGLHHRRACIADGRPGELFITMAKEGSTIGGLMDCFGTAVSMSLQYGVPLEVYVNKFSHTRFEPMGYTKNPDIRIAKSIVDYIFRWLGITFLPGYREAMLGKPSAERRAGRRGARRRGDRDAARRHEGRRAEAPGQDRPPKPARRQRPHEADGNGQAGRKTARARPTATPSAGAGRRDAGRSRTAGTLPNRERAIRQLPDRRPQLRQLRRDHRPQRQLLPLPQLRQQHGLLVKDCRAGCPRATHWRAHRVSSHREILGRHPFFIARSRIVMLFQPSGFAGEVLRAAERRLFVVTLSAITSHHHAR